MRRLTLLRDLKDNPAAQAVEKEFCRRDPVHWFNNWAWTYDPRAVANKLPAYLPFDLFPRQVDLVGWLLARVAGSEEGLVEKSRDVGWTWVAAGFALNRWLFCPGFKTTFGSRKEEYVDRIGDPDSIFEKIRLLYYRLPLWMRPVGFDPNEHDNFRRLINPANGNVIVGEAGDNMGRGGRATLYLVDEGAYIERAERVEASIVANADCRVWASSVNGRDNLFARKRHEGGLRQEQIFRFHWRDDPRKDDAWAAKVRATLETRIWAAEYDIDYEASADGVQIFVEAKLLVDGAPVPVPQHVDYVFAVVDSALKDGTEHDGTGVSYYAVSKHIGYPLVMLDWDAIQVNANLLPEWMPSVFATLEHWAAATKARGGSAGVFIEDKASGIVLNQHGASVGWPTTPIDSKLTSLGKDSRALLASPHVHQEKVKFSQPAYDKVTTYKGASRNHMLSQITGFRIGDKNAAKRADDLSDTFCYAAILALGDSDGF